MIKGPITRPRFIVTILSCTIILVPPGGLTYGFNSITPYLLSYIVNTEPDSDVTKAAFSWVYTALLVGQAISMITGGLLERVYSTQKLALVAVSLFNVNLFLMYWSCRTIISLALSYLCVGLSLGLIYVMSIVVGLSWINPEYHGLFAGIISLGYGLSSVAVSPLQCLYVNPNNFEPIQNNITGDYIFTDPSVLSNIPRMFIVYGVLSVITQLPLSFILVKNPEITGEDVANNKPVKELFRKPEFYLLFVIFGLNKVSLAYIGTYAKFYGETFLNNDLILSIVIGLTGVFNALGRPFWGHVYDRFGSKRSLFLLSLSTGLCILFSYLSKFLPGDLTCGALYTISVWGAFFCCTGNYAIMPAAAIHYFGQENLGVKYGILYLSQGLGAMMSALYTTLIPFWMPLVLTIVFTTFVSGLLALILREKQREEGQHISLLGSSSLDSLDGAGFQLHEMKVDNNKD